MAEVLSPRMQLSWCGKFALMLFVFPGTFSLWAGNTSTHTVNSPRAEDEHASSSNFFSRLN